MELPSPRIKPMRTRLAHALLGASLTAVGLGAALLAPVPALAQVAAWQTGAQPIEFVRGHKHWSETRSHFVVLNPDGNLVVAKADGGYVWGFDTQPNIDHRLVGRVAWQPDGNLVAYDAKGGYLWSALSKDPDSRSRLVLQSNGALQIVSPQRGVLWSSDGKLSAPGAAPVTTVPAPAPKPAPAPAAPAPAAEGVAGKGFPFTAGQTIPQDVEFISPSKRHFLTFQRSGNLVVASAGKKAFLWGLNVLPAVDFRQIRSVRLSSDGNLVGLGEKGNIIWKALNANPDPASRLELSYGGALQLVSPSRGILWSSDGILEQPIRVDSRPAGVSACKPEAGWSKCVQLASPTIKIMGTPKVSDQAITAAANVYAGMFARLKPAFPGSSFNEFRVYMTNGETERQLAALPVVGQMWTDGYGPRSRAALRGGASHDFLWIEEQMICKEGIVTRNEDFAAGRAASGDNAYRSFDQVIHEMAHSIDSRYKLMDTRLRRAYQGDPTEQFPQGVQAWFGAPVREFGAQERVLLQDLFTARATFSCEGVVR
ncbi:hypothetical protein [Stenotrophomonas sp. PS02297]|uniref:hypothetical protein n=1 Tax=Stenotrophomonas sp. PS02297 TaxID=2991423 RepID=UPI00249A12FB|nr:hypothetical protein [Stenotrophomonas sp. PS02297]